MGEEALIRREALLAVLKSRGLKEMHAQVAFLADLRDSDERIARDTYWRDLLKGNKSFGEKMARKIEAAMEPPLPRGYLDVPPGRAGSSTQPDVVLYGAGGELAVIEAKKSKLGAKGEPPKPDPKFTDRRQPPTESEWAILDSLRAFPEEERERVRTEFKQKADYWERIARDLLKHRAGS
jgi:hypothetical protein